MKLWIDVEDSAGARQGNGPITTALGWNYSELMDGAGTFGMEMPGQDARAALASAKRVLRARGIVNGAVADLGAGIVDQRDLRVSGRGRSMLSLSGSNLLRELANLHVGSLTIDDGSGGTVVTGPSLIMVLAPAGWSLDTTAGFANTIKSIYHQYEGESVLEALVRLAEITGEHFRLGAGRTVIWMRRNGSAKVLHGGITGAFTPGETVTGATSGATGTVQEATATYLYIESASGSFAVGESVAGAAGSVTATAVYNPDSGIRAVQGASSSRADSNTRICMIRNLDYVQDTFDTHIGRVYAYGVGNADSRITLDGETAPWAGWTVSSDTKGWFLQNDATWAAYGIERVVSWKDIDNATTLMELAYEWLLRRLSAQEFYRLSVVKLDAEINLGQTLRVIYHEWRDGYHAVDIDSNLIVLEKSTRINSDGVREVDLTVSTIDRFPEDDTTTSVGNMVNSRDYYQHDQPLDAGVISTLDTLTITRWLVVNESGGDNDTRFESQWDPNMFFLDASASRIGLLTNDPHATLDVRGDVIINEDGGAYDFRVEGDSQQNLVYVHATQNNVGIGRVPMVGVTLHVGGVVKIDTDIVVDGSTTLNSDGGASGNTQIRGMNNNNLLYAKAAADKIGIGHKDPKAILDVHGNASEVTAIFQVNATTPGNILECRSSAAVALMYVDKDGNVVVKSDSTGVKLGSDVDMLIYSDGPGALWIKPLAADTDTTLNFYGTTASGVLKWMEDEDYFDFADAVRLSGYVGFYGTTPIAQQTTAVGGASFTQNSGTAVNDASTFDGYTIGQIVKALRNLGIVA